jgi:uncharacterized protein YlxP (DUF503 family)
MAFICVLTIELHFPHNASLKGKRKELAPLKHQLQRRFGASVAETDHHDLWQRATLIAALAGRRSGELASTADDLQRFVEGRHPEGARIARRLVSTDDLGAY